MTCRAFSNSLRCWMQSARKAFRDLKCLRTRAGSIESLTGIPSAKSVTQGSHFKNSKRPPKVVPLSMAASTNCSAVVLCSDTLCKGFLRVCSSRSQNEAMARAADELRRIEGAPDSSIRCLDGNLAKTLLQAGELGVARGEEGCPAAQCRKTLRVRA